MLASFRRLSKSKVGTIIMVLFLAAIVASFALADISNVTGGSLTGGSSSALAEVGGEEVTERDLSRALERRLSEVRQQNPEADYSALARDFDPLLQSLIDMKTLVAFANRHGFVVSKRLIDAEIANLPGTRGLDGKFSDAAYQQFLSQQRLTDAEVREAISSELLQRLLLTPVASNARVPVGVATPYASMLLELREGGVAMIPASAFRAGLNPSDADVQRFYATNRSRYTVPEQRVLRMARIGPEQVAGVAASAAEVAAYYKANQAAFGAKETRVISQAVVPDKAAADAIAARARGGASFAAAAAPAGLSAADISVGPQTRAQFTGLAGDKVAAAAFGAAAGAVVGPVQSDLGWHVVKVDSVRTEGGKTLAQASAEIAAKLTAEKRTTALADLVATVEDAVADGKNFAEAAAEAKLAVIQTPPITGAGVARGDPAYRFPADLAPALKAGFELAPEDEPVVETLAEERGYVLVAPAQVVAAAPAPLASIRDRVAADWVNFQAAARARTVASAIAAKVARGTALDKALAEAGTSLPRVQPVRMRRLDLSRAQGEVPAPVRMLFNLGAGKSRMVADPRGQGFYVVKLDKVTPGNALSQPSLITQLQRDFQRGTAEEYAQQFLAAIRGDVGVRRNDKAIADARKRILGE